MPVNHQYRAANLVTWAHETTHGYHGNLRNANARAECYYLWGKEPIIFIPKWSINLKKVQVPEDLQGLTYNTYLKEASKDKGFTSDGIPIKGWDSGYYLFDEWVAYCNGTSCSINLPKGHKDKSESEPRFAVELGIYATCGCMQINGRDKNLMALLKSCWERTLDNLVDSGASDEEINNLIKEGSVLGWLREALGKEWVDSNFGKVE